jgi:hypothetical protein
MRTIRDFLLFCIVLASISYAGAQKKRIAFFIAEGFPTVDAPVIDDSIKIKIAGEYNSGVLNSVNSLNEKLDVLNYDLLILAYGSAFPIDAWQTIYNFLNSGGSLVYLGGSPFNQPVLWKDSTWIPGIPQQTFARQLLIGPSDKIKINSTPFYSAKNIFTLNNFELNRNELVIPETVYEMTVRFTTKKDFQSEDGSSGPREAIIRPLVHITNKDNLPFAAPLIEIERLQGDNAGARWIFSANDSEHSETVIKRIIDRALEGAIELNANPVFASTSKGEIPLIRVNLFQPKNKENHPVGIDLIVKNEQNKIIFSGKAELLGTVDFKTATVAIQTPNKLNEGFYSVEIIAGNLKQQVNRISTGFWVWDSKLALSSPEITVSKDWIRKDGRVFPIIGTTYMASDVHRKFLFEPNPYVWNNDFKLMKESGINYIRTGIWNSWSRIMIDRGAVDESVLRALDAYVMTAVKHNIVVCFTFFAFTPPLNGGTNPYLDPRAIEWQKTFITLIAKRYKDINWIHFDLINEPSYSPPNDIWKNSPAGDQYEKTDWAKWLSKKHKLNSSGLQNLWRDSKGDIYSVPAESELTYRIYKQDRRPRKALDFNLFTQDVVTGWADTLNKTIKAVNNALVTLGQDEGGTSNRPSPQFHYTAVDYTSVHTWWNNDDLLWDGLITKTPERPNLISETGLMRLEEIDGNPWRSSETASQLLDRKFAAGFASRGAGVVQWAWNINPYMPIDNESVIGFFRPDGTAKMEIEVLKKYSNFFEQIKSKLEDFEEPEVIVVIPHSKIFSGRKNGELSTRRIVRAFTDHLGINPSLISEFKLTYQRLSKSKLVVVPSVEFLDDDCANNLFNAGLNGTKILFTGSIEGNSYGEITENISKLGLDNRSEPVSLFEKYISPPGSDKNGSSITFDNQQSEFIKKCSAEKFYSNGNILHEPLPIELAREKEPLIGLLKNGLNLSGVDYLFDETPLSTNILYMQNYTLVICMNESSFDITKELIINNFNLRFNIGAERSKLFLIEKNSGKIIAETN